MNKVWESKILEAINTLNSLSDAHLQLDESLPLDDLNIAIQNFALNSRYASRSLIKDPISQVYFDYALTGILETDEHWTIHRANQAAASLTGYEIAQLQSQNIALIANEEAPTRVEKHLRFLEEQGISQSSWQMRKKNHALIILDIASIQVDEHRYIHVFDDVTELRQAADAMQLAVIRAEEANRAKSQFLANISHELRTPLNGLIGLSQLLAATSLEEKQREFVNKMHLSGVNLLHIVNDLLDISKLETGKMQYEDAPFTLQQLQDDLTATLALAKENTDLSVQIVIDADVPAALQGDRYRIAQCLTNLLGNAIKFTQQGSVTLSVKTEKATDNNASIIFQVTDTGIGIADEILPKLFQLFSQADASTTRRYGGTGLGLAISRQIARDLHGDLTAQSKQGEGSCFTLTLPLRIAQQTPVTELEQDLDVPQEFAGNKILIAEDNEVNQVVIAELLRLANIQTAIADNGLKVLSLLQRMNPKPDAILMDVQMPEMDGLTATKQLRKDGVIIPIIGLSAGASKEEQDLCFESGMSDFLSKPIDADELWGCLTRWLRPKQTHAATPKAVETPLHQSPVYQRAFQAFIRQHESDAEKLSLYIKTQDQEAVCKLAHSLKGAAALMGFEQLSNLASGLENTARASDDFDAIADYLPRLEKELTRAIPASTNR